MFPQKGHGHKAVQRSDGKTYVSIAEAVRILKEEKGYCDMNVRTRIGKSCRTGKPKTVHGYQWKFL